jgi:hypothetical protein
MALLVGRRLSNCQWNSYYRSVVDPAMGLNGHGFDNFHGGLNEVVTELSRVDANWLNIANVHRLAARVKGNFKGR